ncbi:MAG TPA: hypothetical protein V6D19_02745 [Stenomitos sp.]
MLETNRVATTKPKLTLYLKNGYKAKLEQYVALKGGRILSTSSTGAEIIENFLDELIEQGVLSPITDEDIASELNRNA